MNSLPHTERAPERAPDSGRRPRPTAPPPRGDADRSPEEAAIVVALRRIAREVDRHSHRIAADCGLTGPQLTTLHAIAKLRRPTLSELSRDTSIGPATLTGVVDRLQRADLVERTRDERDRRRVAVSLTDAGRAALHFAPPILEGGFRRELASLPEWERTSILATLQRVARMMARLDGDDAPTTRTPPHETTEAAS